MGRFAEKYSDEQRDTIVRAQLDWGMKPLEAVTAAKEGKLGIPPFDFNRETAKHYAQKERDKRAGRNVHAMVREKPLEALQRIVELQLSTLMRLTEKAAQAGDRKELEALARWEKVLMPQVEAVLGKPEEPKNPGTVEKGSTSKQVEADTRGAEFEKSLKVAHREPEHQRPHQQEDNGEHKHGDEIAYEHLAKAGLFGKTDAVPTDDGSGPRPYARSATEGSPNEGQLPTALKPEK